MKKAGKRILIAIFIVGALLLLYPVTGNLINTINQMQVMDKYEETVNLIDDDEVNRMYEDAVKYNETVFKLQKADSRYTLAEDYEKVLQVNDTGVMGYIEVPKANVKLPIYHGVEDNVLQQGVGHVRESSLPIGTENQNSMLLGHSGVPNSRLFTELDRTEIGDLIKITVLKHELYYRIYETEVVEPDNLVEKLKVEEGRDLITLVTCVPYSVNSHRLVIHAERYNPEGVAEEFAETVSKPPIGWILLGCAVGGLAAVAIGEWLDVKRQKRKMMRLMAVWMATVKIPGRRKTAKKKTSQKKRATKKRKGKETKKDSKTKKGHKTAKAKKSNTTKKRGKR